MIIQESAFGKLKSGEEVQLFTLKNVNQPGTWPTLSQWNNNSIFFQDAPQNILQS